MTKNTYMSQKFHKCPKFFQTGSLCTCLKRYKLFGIVGRCRLGYIFKCDDSGALFKSIFKHFKTNFRNYRRCHALRQYQLQLC